jgi:O-succinylbenzoic acid--CoA ligase
LATGGIFTHDLFKPSDLEHIHQGHITTPKRPGLGLTTLYGTPARAWAIHNLPTSQASTIPLPLWQRAQHHPNVCAVEHAEGTLTYKELWQMVCTRISGLRARGVRPGDAVGVWADNNIETMVSVHACLTMGALLVPLHPTWEATQVDEQAKRAHCVCLLTDDTRAKLTMRVPVYAMSMIQGNPAHAAPNIEVSLHEPAAVLLTSGTTGSPKMVLLTWQNLVFSATGSAITLGHLPGDRWLCVLPVCHIAGLSILFRCALLGTTVILPNSFDAASTAKAITHGHITLASLVPTMLQDVMTHINEQGAHTSFRAVLLGGGAISDDLLQRAQALKIPVAPTYGMTEASSQIATLPPWAKGPGVGGPLVWTQVRLSPELGQGSPGEGRIEVKSPTCSPGYVEESAYVEYIEQNSRCLELSGSPQWLDTGDWGRWDPDTAHLEILDRRTDLIVSGGENVSPQHVELALERHPCVVRACVVGLPDPRWGAKVIAVVQTNDQQMPSDLNSWCRRHLAPYEVPKALLVWPDLPKTALGKINRAHVRQRLLTPTSPLHP